MRNRDITLNVRIRNNTVIGSPRYILVKITETRIGLLFKTGSFTLVCSTHNIEVGPLSKFTLGCYTEPDNVNM